MNANYVTAVYAPGCRLRGNRAPARRCSGLTLIELMIAVAIASVITLIAVPAYSQHVERARVAQAIADILEMNLLLQRYHSDKWSHPEDLAAIGQAGKLDPWGQPYVYLNLETAGTSKARKNKKLHPLNSDYDLYSIGKDGDSKLPLTAKPSRDDIVRANDGSFINLASNYDK